MSTSGGAAYDDMAGWSSQEEPNPDWLDEDPANDNWRYAPVESHEEYDDTPEGPFKAVATSPLSTFSADVDTASYASMRRFIDQGAEPQGIRIEELVNYFDYNYPPPNGNSPDPFSVTTDIAPCPWEPSHLLARIGVQGMEAPNSEVANNIVFLLDVSGSMGEDNKLPLLQDSFSLLIDELGSQDVVSIVTYAGSDKVVADSIPGDQHRELKKKVRSLNAGGSTGGAKGVETAYELARKNFIEDGNNRVILATDGDFNVGPATPDELISLIEDQREDGIAISVLGFGMYNLKDNNMEAIADHGNGNYAYIDTLAEAEKVLVKEFDSTMLTIAQDVKFQVEFNPAVISQYRLIGYNNRVLEDEDFNDDTKDAGEIGAGHSVTAFYELVPAGQEGPASVDPLRYQRSNSGLGSEFFNVKLRYKDPGGTESKLVDFPVPASAFTDSPDGDFAFAAAVAEFGLILTDSDHAGYASLDSVRSLAEPNLGEDSYGLRAEFLNLVKAYRQIVD
jgi:Ca-activated chloride channel family protein